MYSRSIKNVPFRLSRTNRSHSFAHEGLNATTSTSGGLEFSDAELTWRKAGYDLAAARYGYFQSMAELDYAMGRTAEILGEQPEERSAEARDEDRWSRRSRASGLARR